jgi:uncharacterized protein HemX
VGETADKGPQAETPNKETPFDHQPLAPNRRSSRMTAIVVSLSALVLVGAAAAYALPNFNSFSFAGLFPREAASAPIPDPAVSVALGDIQSSQQRNAAALQENGAVLRQNAATLQQDAATLESLRQSFTSQQTDLKRISNQLSSLMARVDSLQNAMTPVTTSSIPQPNARVRAASRKKTSRLPEPFGPVSVGGAPLSPAPALGSGAG